MTTIPSENTTQHLKKNEQLCYSCGGLNCQLNFQTFRLYLPSFPRKDINAVIEIPFYLARQFSLSLENYLSNAMELIFVTYSVQDKLQKSLRRERSPKFLVISSSSKKSSEMEIMKPENLIFKRTEYFVKNLKDFIGSIKVEIFQNIPSMSLKMLIENCRDILEFQNAHMIKLIGCIQFCNMNLFIRITEDFCMDLSILQQIYLKENEFIDRNSRSEVALFILAEMLVALDYLHERGITHRHLCPKNIKFDISGHVKIGGIFDSMNNCRDIVHLYDNWNNLVEKDLGFSSNLNEKYLDPEVLHCLLEKKTLEAYVNLDCLSDVFSLGIMVIETLSGVNFLDINMWRDVYDSMFLPTSDHGYLVEIYLNQKMQMILRQRLTDTCGFVSKEFYAFLLLMLQPKINRMRGLRIHVQRHRFLNTSGCEYKLRLELVKRHPVFKGINIDNVFIDSSPVLRFLATLNNS